jgi:20S proteasome alpha/beta subunit
MTVGIGAAYKGDDPAVVLVADRMVTTGAVEHEHSDGKLEMVKAGTPAVAAVAAGTLSYADELYYQVGNRVLNESPDTVQAVADLFVEEMHAIVQSEANNQILSDYDLTLNQLTNEGVPLSDDMVGQFLQQISDLKQNIHANTNMLIAGVDDEHGAQLLELRDGSLTRHRSLGYQCIGSGAGSASLTFMRNGYDPESIEDALMLAADAKNQAGEAQGVGDKMDIAVVTDDVKFLEEERIKNIQYIIEDVRDAERDARESVINDADIDSLR